MALLIFCDGTTEYACPLISQGSKAIDYNKWNIYMLIFF